MQVIDSHVHFFSRIFYECQAAEARPDDVAGMMTRMETSGVDVPDSNHIALRDRLIMEFDVNGVEHALVFASVPEEMAVVGEAAFTSDGRMSAFATVNPKKTETLRNLETSHAKFAFTGMILFPAMHDFGIGDDDAAAALDLARKLGLIVFVHCGLLRVPVRAVVGLEADYPMDRAHPEHLIPVAKARPDQTFVVPHFGAGFFDEFLKLGAACPNVYTDTAGANTWGMFQAPPLYLEDLFRQTVDVYGAQRVLFGSDTAGFPRGYREDILTTQIRAMHDAGLRPEEHEAILRGNLSRILDL